MKLGGFLKDTLNKAGQGIGNYGKMAADMTLSGVGMSDVITDDNYKGFGSKLAKGVVDVNQQVRDIAKPIVSAVAPGAGAVIQGTEMAGGAIMGDDINGGQLASAAMGMAGGVDMLSKASTNDAALRNVPSMENGGKLPISKYTGLKHVEGGIDIGVAEVEDGELQWDMIDGNKYVFSNSLGTNGKVKRKQK